MHRPQPGAGGDHARHAVAHIGHWQAAKRLHNGGADRAGAAMDGEACVRPDDVKAVAAAILAHRVIPRAELRAKGQTTESLIERLLETVPVPAVK